MSNEQLLKILGQNIRKYRQAKKYTQEQMAERIGISTTFYANLERGTKGVSIFVLRRIADVLKISVDSLLYEDRPDTHLRNVTIFLQDKPPQFVDAVDKIIRLCANEFSSGMMHYE